MAMYSTSKRARQKTDCSTNYVTEKAITQTTVIYTVLQQLMAPVEMSKLIVTTRFTMSLLRHD